MLEDITMDPNLSPKVRIDAAKALFDRAGYVVKPLAPGAFEDELNQVSREELERLVARIREQNAAEAKDVTPAEAAAMFDWWALSEPKV